MGALLQGTANPTRPIADNGVPPNRKVNADDDDTDDEHNDDDDAVVLFSRPKNGFEFVSENGLQFGAAFRAESRRTPKEDGTVRLLSPSALLMPTFRAQKQCLAAASPVSSS